MRKYLAFDIEIAKVIPEEETDWIAHRPLGITCAAAMASDGRQWLWYAERLNEFQSAMSWPRSKFYGWTENERIPDFL